MEVFTPFGSVAGIGYLYDLCSWYSKCTSKFLSLIGGVGHLYDICSEYSKPTHRFLRSIHASHWFGIESRILVRYFYVCNFWSRLLVEWNTFYRVFICFFHWEYIVCMVIFSVMAYSCSLYPYIGHGLLVANKAIHRTWSSERKLPIL